MKARWWQAALAAGLLLAGILFVATPHADAATCTAVAGGGLCTGSPSWYLGWADGSTWTGCTGSCAGTGSGCPTASDDVVIPSNSCVRVGITGALANTVSVSGPLYFGNRNNGVLGNLNVTGNFTINPGGSVQPSASGPSTLNGASSLFVGGNFTNNGSFAAITASHILDVRVDGSGAQSVGGTNSTTFNNLEIVNTSADSAGVSLGNNETVNGTLTLTDGLLKVAGYNLSLGTGASISGGSVASMVVTDIDGSAAGDGYLCKILSGNVSFTFPVGDAFGTAEYSPSTLAFTGGTLGPNSTICVRVTNARHPNWPGSQYPTYITRYWTATSTDDAFTCTASFVYTNADVVLGSGQTEAALFHKIWDGANWTTKNQTNTGTNTLSSVVNSFSDHTAFSGSPLAVTLESMEAVAAPEGSQVDVTWQTVAETDNQGFNLWRSTSPDGSDIQLNAAIIPSQAPGSTIGASYAYADSYRLTPGTTYYYWLEDVNLEGAVNRHEPVSATYAGPTAVGLAGFGATQALPPALPLAAAGLALAAVASAARVALRRR